MVVAGLDFGSRTIALEEWDGAQIIRSEVVDTGTDPLDNARALMAGCAFDLLGATGYGRHLANLVYLVLGQTTTQPLLAFQSAAGGDALAVFAGQDAAGQGAPGNQADAVLLGRFHQFGFHDISLEHMVLRLFDSRVI